MREINQIYVNGEFILPQGNETLDLINPSNKEVITRVRLADETDTQKAICAAKEAFKTFSKTTKEERIALLKNLHESFINRESELVSAVVEEYGAPISRARNMVKMAGNRFVSEMEILEDFNFSERSKNAGIFFEPIGVVGLISPWNADYYFIAKIATILATGCTVVIKPSELSAYQTQIMTECIHNANLPKGVVNVVTGRGDVVGNELSINPDVDQISFTGSTSVGKIILQRAADTVKKVGLELGGKSANIILEDADLQKAIPRALQIAYMNNGQACLAGTRLLIPERKLEEIKNIIKFAIKHIKIGDPNNEETTLGPIITQKQFNRVQNYIKIGLEEGAELLVGGLDSPEGLENGYYVKPTVFTNVTMDMTIAKEEIFGPVLSVLTYQTEKEAIEIANNTTYGLAGYISASDTEHANKIALELRAGTIFINDPAFDEKAPFGGYKQSGLGRENGRWGFEEYLEVKTIMLGNTSFPL